MRLWHQKLIPKLPRQQLLGQHRECAALRGLGWGKKHSTVDYVFKYPVEWLVAYHNVVMMEMDDRGYKVDTSWFRSSYRGKTCDNSWVIDYDILCDATELDIIYPEHDDAYYKECVENLRGKGIVIE